MTDSTQQQRELTTCMIFVPAMHGQRSGKCSAVQMCHDKFGTDRLMPTRGQVYCCLARMQLCLHIMQKCCAHTAIAPGTYSTSACSSAAELGRCLKHSVAAGCANDPADVHSASTQSRKQLTCVLVSRGAWQALDMPSSSRLCRWNCRGNGYLLYQSIHI